MKQYHSLLEDILTNGEEKSDRTGTGTISVFSRQLRFNLKEGFPAITTKKLAWKACVGELLWFVEGSHDERRLAEITHGTREGVATIWSPNAMAPSWQHKAQFEGDLGRIYGVQWRNWKTTTLVKTNSHASSDHYDEYYAGPVQTKVVDQLKNLIDGLKNDPNGRRHIISSWNVSELDQMALPPCHVMSQFHVNSKRELSCHMYQRSVDVFLGLPFNIASYALLTHLIAQVCGYSVNELVISTGDTHIYSNHVDQVKEQLTRGDYPLPVLALNPEVTDITKFMMDDIKLIDYQSHGQIKAEMAV